jgi:hypothetical protein
MMMGSVLVSGIGPHLIEKPSLFAGFLLLLRVWLALSTKLRLKAMKLSVGGWFLGRLQEKICDFGLLWRMSQGLSSLHLRKGRKN